MKKEKKVRTYQRRTKSGKMITVRAHTASYEAAEKAKEAAKKKGAGDELSGKVKKGEEWKLPMDEFLKKLKEERAQKRDDETKKVEDEKPKKTEKKTPAKKAAKKRTVGTGTNGPEPKKKAATKKTATKTDTSEPAFTRDEFKEWYRGTGSAADKKVAKALRKQLGRSGYRKFEDEAIDNYTSRGHLSMFKRVSGGSSASPKTAKSSVKTSKVDKGKAMKAAKNADSSKMFKGVFSDDFGTVDKVVRNVVLSDLPKLRTLPKGMAKWHEYSLGGDVNDHSVAISNAKRVLERMPENMYNRAYKEWKASMNGSTSKATASTKSSKASSKSLAKRWDSTPPNDKMDAKARKSDAPKSEAEFVKRLKNEAGKSRGVGSIFNSGTATYRGSVYDLYKKRGTYYAVNRKTGKLATDSMTAKIMASPKKRSVGTGTNGPEPKKTKTSAELKKEYESALADEKKQKRSSDRKQAKALYEKYGTSHKEVSAFMKESKRKWSWDRERNAFTSGRLANGSPMRGIATMSLQAAINRMIKKRKK